MAHRIDMTTGRPALAYCARHGTPWHGLGVASPGLMTPIQAIVAACLDWRAIEHPLGTPIYSVDGLTGWREVPSHKVLVRSDTSGILGVVGEGYKVVQNQEVAEILSGGFGTDTPSIDVAGAIDDGRRIWFLARLPDTFEVRPGDPIEQNLLLTAAHDGSGAIQAINTPIRVVCANTLTLAFREADRATRSIYSIRHTGDATIRAHALANTIAASTGYWTRLRAAFGSLAAQAVTRHEVGAVLRKLFPDNVTEDGEVKPTAQVLRARVRVVELFDGAAQGAAIAGSTRWGLLQAVTQYIDQEQPTRGVPEAEQAGTRRLRSLLGDPTAQGLRQAAFDLLLQSSLT